MVKKKKLLNIEFSNQLICTWSEDQTRIGVILFHSSTKLFATLNELKFENLLALWKEFRAEIWPDFFLSEPEIPNKTGWKHFEPYYRKHEWILGSTKNHLWSNPCLEKKGFSSSPKSWMLLDKLGFIKDPIKSILIEGKQTRSIVTYLCHFRSTIVVDRGILILVLCIEVSFISVFNMGWMNKQVRVLWSRST